MQPQLQRGSCLKELVVGGTLYTISLFLVFSSIQNALQTCGDRQRVPERALGATMAASVATRLGVVSARQASAGSIVHKVKSSNIP